MDLGWFPHFVWPPPPKPAVVQVITVTAQNVPIYKEWISALEGLVNAQIRTVD
jgi:hypothetical protein